jgi:hypothetical protein
VPRYRKFVRSHHQLALRAFPRALPHAPAFVLHRALPIHAVNQTRYGALNGVIVTPQALATLIGDSTTWKGEVETRGYRGCIYLLHQVMKEGLSCRKSSSLTNVSSPKSIWTGQLVLNHSAARTYPIVLVMDISDSLTAGASSLEYA